MSSTTNNLRILVIDDNRDAAVLMVEVLTLFGHDVLAAYGGVDGVELAETWKPDVVLLDLTMPVLDGFQVAEKLRQSPTCRGAYIIAFSALSDPATKAQTAVDFDFHLTKPAPVEKIVQAISMAPMYRENQAFPVLEPSNLQMDLTLERRFEHPVSGACSTPAHAGQM